MRKQQIDGRFAVEPGMVLAQHVTLDDGPTYVHRCPLESSDISHMRFRSENIRIQKIAEAQRKLAQGIYDNAYELNRILDEVIDETGPDSFISDLQKCPVGEGHQYRDLVHKTMLRSFGGHIDDELSRIEGAAGGGRMDIELPLRYKALQQEAIFADWSRRFGLKSLIVECKNQKGRARATGAIDLHLS